MMAKLYTTLGCHLCEQAEQLLMDVLPQYPGLEWQAVEIADDPVLVERYGVSIPVIALTGVSEELGWPFDADALIDYLGRHLG